MAGNEGVETRARAAIVSKAVIALSSQHVEHPFVESVGDAEAIVGAVRT